MSEIDLKTKNVIRIFVVNPKDFSKLSSLDFEFLKDLLLKINAESENKETHVDQINTLSLSLELIKIIVFNNYPCNFEGLFKLLIDRVIDAIHIKASRCGAINLLLKLIEEEFISNEKYVENNKNTIKKMDIIIDEESKTDIKELIKSLRESVLNKELNLYSNTESAFENKIMSNNLSISSTMIQEGLLNFQNKAYNSILKMSKSENMKFHSKLTNGLFVKMIMKLYKDSNGGKVITKCLVNDFQLPLIISENTENNYLMELIENVEISDDKRDIFNRVDKYFSEIHDILIMVQLMKYFSLDIDNLESILSIFLSVVTASYMHLLSSLINKKYQESTEEAITLSSLEFLNKFICEISIMFENLHMNKPLVVFGAMNILVFHKFVKVAEKTCPIEYQQLIHSNQDFLSLSRTVLQKLTNLINFAAKESELNWKHDCKMSTTSNLTDMLNSSSRNWLCIILNNNNLKVVLFWLESLHCNTSQMITYLNEQNTLSSLPQVGPTDILYVDDDDGPGEEYGLNHLFTDYQEKVKPSISNTSSLIRYESRNDNQKLSVPFVSEILKTISYILMNEDPVIHDLIYLQFDKQVLQSVFTLALLLDQEIINLRESHSNNDLNELTKLFVNFINLLFSSNVISQFRSIDILSIIFVKLPKDCVIKESDIPMNLELGPMVLLIIMNVCIQFTNPLSNQQSSISWLKSDIYIKLMWKNMLHSIQQTILNENSKCIDVRQEFFQLFLLIFHGLTSISGKTEIVMDLLNCISFCSSKSGTQPRLLSRLLIILNYLLHHFYEQAPNLAYQLQYNLLTKYISEPINVDICHYQYEEVQVFDQKINGIFYDISVPWSIGKNFWPGPNPDNLILKHMCNNQQYELFFNGVLNAIQICFDHHQAYDEPQKYSLLSFASSFYNFLSNWRLLEIMPLPDKYMNEEHTFQFDNYSKLLNNFFRMKNEFKNLLLTKNECSEEPLLTECKIDKTLSLDQFVLLVAELCEKMCLQLKNEPKKLSHLPQQIYQIDMMIVLLNFILQCLKEDLDTTKEVEKSSITLKCFLNMNGIEHHILFKEIISIILRIYESLIRHITLLLSKYDSQTEFVSFDLSSLTKMASMELKFDSVDLELLKSLNSELEKLIRKANINEISKDSNEITYSQVKHFLTLKLFDKKFCMEHENIIEMIRAESYRRFVFIIDHCKSDQFNQIADSSKLILSTTMVAIEDLRDLFSLLDNCLSESPNLPIDCHGKYLDLILLSNINTFIPVNNLPLKSLKSIPNSIYNQVIARKLFNIFSDFTQNNSCENDVIYFEVMNQSIDCLINMMDRTSDLSCLKEIVSVFLEKTPNESYSNVYAIFNIVFNGNNNIPVVVKCSLLRLINLILYRYKISENDIQMHEVLSKLHYKINDVISEKSNGEMISRIKNWVHDILMNTNFSNENIKSDYLANVLLFSELLALTSHDEGNETNLCNVICQSILQMDEKVRSWLINYRNGFVSLTEYNEFSLINLHVIIEMMCIISNGNCPISIYVNVIQTLLDWNKEINKTLCEYVEHKQQYGANMELMCASLTKVYNHIGAVICALNTFYQSENVKINEIDILHSMKPNSELYLNDFHMKHLSVDKKAIEEILFCQVKYIPNIAENDITNSESEEEKVLKLNPLDDQLCTFAATQKEFTDQHWYHCHTCSMVENEGVCTVCAKVCHFGHDLTYAKRGSFFCDCGAKGNPFCEALIRRTNKTASSKKAQLVTLPTTPADISKKEKLLSKYSISEKTKYSFLTKFSKFPSNDKLLRKNFKTDSKNRLSGHKITTFSDVGQCQEITNEEQFSGVLASTEYTNSQSKQDAYRNWITNVLRERILKENETLTILLETSTLLDDCFSALKIIHESFKILYSDWAVGKNKQMKESFKSVRTNEKISERVTSIMGSSIQLRNAEPPSDMSGIPPTSVLASEIAGANSHVRGMLQSGYVRRNVLAVVSPNRGVIGDQYFLAVAQDKSRIMIYRISSLLEELHDATLMKENNGNVEEESVELDSKQGVIEQVCTTTLPFTVLSMCTNPANKQYMSICGLKEVSVLIFTSMGSISSKTTVQPVLEDSNQFIIYSMWLPGSLNYLVLVLTQSVQIFDLCQTTTQPIYHFKSVESRFKDATFAFIPAKSSEPNVSQNIKSECYVLVMSESGCIHCKKLDKSCMASSGFYLAEMLDWNPELYNMNRDLKTGVLGKGGASIHYDHNLQLLFHSYNNGRTFCSVLDSGQDEIYVDKNYCVDIKNETEYDCTLVNWFSINDHPGLLTAICQQTNSPVYISVEPDKYCFQMLEKPDNSESEITDISVSSLSKVTDAITFSWKTTLNDKKKLQRTLSMVLFNDGRIKILMANIKSPNTDGRFWLQERFANSFLSECLQGVTSHACSKSIFETSSVDCIKNCSKRYNNKDEIFLDNPSCGQVPVDFFEHCETTNEVLFGGDRFLELYSQDVLNLRMLSQDHSVTVACKNPVTMIITNKKTDSIIVGIRIGINVSDPTKIPKYFEIYNRKIPIPEHLNKNRLVDIGLYKSEILRNDKSLTVTIGPSKNVNDIIVIDYVKVFVRSKSSLLWLNEKQELLRMKDNSKFKNHPKNSSCMERINKSIANIITNHSINLSSTNPYLPKSELLSSGLQLLTAFFHFKNALNLEGRPTFSSSEIVTSSVIRLFSNDILSSFYPSSISLNAITLLACVESTKQIDGGMEPRFKKSLISNIGHKLFSSGSDIIIKLKDEEIDPVNVLLVEATVTRLAHLINLHKFWICIDEEKFSSLSYMEVFDLMTSCIELITEYHAICSSVQLEMGTDSEISILSNFINPVYCQKLDYLPSLIPVIIKGLLSFNFINTENASLISDFSQSTMGSVQLKLTDLLIKLLIDPNLSISHNTRKSLNYFMKMNDKKVNDGDTQDKAINDNTPLSESKLQQSKKTSIEDINQHLNESDQIIQNMDITPLSTDDVQTLSILLPDNPDGPSNENEPDEEELDDREYYCRVDDEWMVAVSNSESNSLGGSTLANDAINFFQQMDTEVAPTMADVMQEMIDNVDDERMLDYALRKSLEDQGGSSNDPNNENGIDSNMDQILQGATAMITSDPVCSLNTEEEQQSMNNTGVETIESWNNSKPNKKNAKQAENLSTPDREYSESNSESDMATFALLKGANVNSKIPPDNSQKAFLICIQKFGIQFIKRLIVKWANLMPSLHGTRSISLYKSILDVIRYMDMHDEEARNVVQNLVGLMIDLVLGVKENDNQLIGLEYDTSDKRLHCQLTCVVLRTLLNFILSGSSIQTLVSSSKDDNNSTAAEEKSIKLSCFNQVFTQNSIAYLTLKLIYERKLIQFCLMNLDQLLLLWRNQSINQKLEKDVDVSTKMLKQTLTSFQAVDMSFAFDWLPIPDLDSVSEMHLLITELILRLPYAVLKLCRNTLKELKTGMEKSNDDKEFMVELVNGIQKESKWHSVLCEFIEVNINENITKASRTLLNSVVGAKHYRTVRDIHLIGGSINKIKLLLEKHINCQSIINRIKLPFDETLKLLELVDSCINKAKDRPSNWKVYCSKCPEILNFLIVNSVNLHHTVGLKFLYLLQLALLESESSKVKKETSSNQSTGILMTSNITSTSASKVDDKVAQNKKPSLATAQLNKQEVKLCRSLTSKLDTSVLAEFVKVYLCEHEESGVRWLTEAVLANLYNHGKVAFRLILLNTLADCWSLSCISPQLADLIGHLLTKSPNWERLDTFSNQLSNDITISSRELLSNPCTPFYSCLQRLAKLPGYYLDPEPCSVCSPPASSNEMHAYRWDSEPTDNRRNQAKAATITGMGLHTASTAINSSDYLTPNVRSNPTVHVFNLRAPYSIQSLTVKFTGTRRQRPQCGVTLYYSDVSTVSTTQMLDQANLWQKVKTVTVSKDMSEMKLDFPVLLTAVYLIFEYDCFTGSINSSDSVKCPRCHSASIQGNVCLNCRDNINQCFRCRSINYAGIDSFICANCSSCRYGRIDFSMVAKPCYDFIEELKSEESREVMINRITTWSETVEKNSQEMIALKQELELLLDQIKMMDAAEMSNQKKINNLSLGTSGTGISGVGAAKLSASSGKTYAEVAAGASAMDDSGLQTRSYRRIRRAAGGENEPEKEANKPTPVTPGTSVETSKEDKKDINQSKHVHEALHQLIMKYSADAKEQQLEISCLWRQLWAAKKAVANYDARLAREKNNTDYFNENSLSSDTIKQHCYTCLLSKLQQQIWLVKGLCFVPDIRNSITNAAILSDIQSLLLGQMLDAVSSSMRQEIVVLTVQITRDRKEEVIKLNQIITSELLFALQTPYLSAPKETRIKVMISLLRSSIACPDSLWELRLRPAFAVLLKASNSAPSSDNCTKIVIAPCIALIQACMRFLVGKLKPPAVVKKQPSANENEPVIECKPSKFSMLPVLNINHWLQDDNSQLFEMWVQATRGETQFLQDNKMNQEQETPYLTQKFASKWFNNVQKKKSFKSRTLKLINVENVHVSQAWLWQALLSSTHQSCRQATHLLVEMLAYQSFERHRIILSVLVQCLPHMVSSIGANASDLMKLCFPNFHSTTSTILQEFQLTNNDTSTQYVALLKRLSQEKHWRCYLVVKCKLIEIIDIAMSRVLTFLAQIEEICLDSWRHCQSKPGLSNGGWAAIHLLKSLAELLLHLQEMPVIANKYRATIVKCLLTSSLNMRRLIVFRSKMTTDMESRFNKTVDDLSKDSEDIIRSFIKIAVSVLKQFPVTDLQSAGHIIEKINAYVCPRDYEHPVFDVVLDIFKGQEDFLPHRMIGVSLSSQSFGHNPTVNDVINFLVRENGVTSDIRLDLICDKKVLMYDLLLEDIYEHVWLCSDSNNKNRPMRLTVRISGLVEDNMPYVENLRKEVPIEHYQRSNELIEGGMHTIIERLEAVDELAHGFSVIASSVRLLNYFIKVPNNDARLIEPGLNTVKVLLQCLLVCLKGGLDEKRMLEYEESTVVPLINLLCQILKLGRTGSIIQQNHMKKQVDELNAIPILLEYILNNSRVELYQKHVIKVPTLLAFEYSEKMSLILDYVVPNFQLLIPNAQIDECQKQMLLCCCNLMSSIPSDEYGTFLRHHMIGKGLLKICIDFLIAVAPEDALKEGLKLDLKRQDTIAFLEQQSLQFVLVLGQACVGSSGFLEAGEKLLAVPGLLGFLHKLETVKSVQAIGVLSEDWLNALKECSSEMNKVISGLRNSTQKNLRAQALKVRQKQLNEMQMTVNDKGQVLTSSSLLKDLSSQVLEEPGHCCDICLDGYVNKPQESLGVYTFVKKVLVHDLMSGKMQALPNSVPCANQYYYTSVSNYVCVHFSCHNQAVKVVNENEWIVAQRHNQNAKCNSLMPILGPHHDNNFKANLNRYQTSIWNNTNVPEINYQLMVHDLKFLLLRFAHNRQFNEDTGGGARLSNIKLVPQIIQIAMANLLSQTDLIIKETQAITKWLEQAGGGSKLFNQNIWQATNTPYRVVQSLLFHSPEIWLQHRLQILKLLLQFAHVRHLNLAEISQIQPTHLEPLSYTVYHPYLVLFGFIQSFYNIFFKNVSSSSGATGKMWMDSLSLYIRENDVALLDGSNKLIRFYEDNLLPCESFQEFWDVTELGDCLAYKDDYLSSILIELKDTTKP